MRSMREYIGQNSKPIFSFFGQIIPQNVFNTHFDELKHTTDAAGNTFYTSILEGIASHRYEVSAVSKLNTTLTKEEVKMTGKVEYEFIPYVSNKYLRYLSMFCNGLKQANQFKNKIRKTNSDGYAIFNILRISTALGGLLGCKLHGIKTIAVITDVPGYRIDHKNQSSKSLADKLGQVLLNRFDSYVILSEAMKDVIDLNGKPYTIIEGVFDASTLPKTDSIAAKARKNFEIVYAGSLHYQYGIMNLVKAVEQLSPSDIHLTIYGQGEAAEEIKKISARDSRIRYGGLVQRDVLLEIEKKASLLVNPRPIEDEYVKYSFPSKNMEYMASGTPTLLTDIASLPDEYKKYVVLAKDNSEHELMDKIMEVYSHEDKYTDIGALARNFILNEKNNMIQSEKIIALAESICK